MSVSLGESVEACMYVCVCMFMGFGQEVLFKYLEVKIGPLGS